LALYLTRSFGVVAFLYCQSIDSASSTRTGSGSVLTVFVPPYENIPNMSDLYSLSDSSRVTCTRVMGDSGLSVMDMSYLYSSDPRVIAPSSLRRKSSLDDLYQDRDTGENGEGG
jgi:hypothetical protein